MHMADALMSPAVGATMWAASAAALAWSARRVQAQGEFRLVPLMGVLGAFVFAAQMINFSIPGTGSSGHLGGAMLLAALLGPHAALVVIASVLTVQALFFADGGLLALGANVFNLGVLPCFVAWPLVYRAIVRAGASPRRVACGAAAAAVVGLLLGAAGVVVQTVASGISALPLEAFALLMLPIHAAIGVVEGLVTAAVLLFVQRAQPELLALSPAPPAPRRPLLAGLALAAAVTAGAVSSFASAAPDGLEWSIEKIAGHAELPAPATAAHGLLARWQEATAWLPDYRLPGAGEASAAAGPLDGSSALAGIVGGTVTLLAAVALGALLARRHR